MKALLRRLCAKHNGCPCKGDWRWHWVDGLSWGVLGWPDGDRVTLWEVLWWHRGRQGHWG